MSQIRVAVIGLGNIAQKHVEVLKAMPACQIVAGVKREAETGRAFCELNGIARYFSSAAQLLDWGEFDAAIVCVGHLLTVQVAREVLATGRPCLIEKPVGFSSAETREVADTAQSAGTWGMVAVNRRFYSNVRRAFDLLAEAGGIKAIRVEHTEWMHQAGTWGLSEEVLDRFFLINGIHLVDTMCHLAGLPQRTLGIVRRQADRRHAYDAMLQFGNGAVGHYSGQWYAPGRWAVDVFAEDLRIAFPCLEQSQILRTAREPEVLELDAMDRQFKPGFFRQMETFLHGVSAATAPASPACLLPEAVQIMGVVETLVNPSETRWGGKPPSAASA